jgi:hypothetical protein
MTELQSLPIITTVEISVQENPELSRSEILQVRLLDLDIGNYHQARNQQKEGQQ